MYMWSFLLSQVLLFFSVFLFFMSNSIFFIWVSLVFSGLAVLPLSVFENMKGSYLKYFIVQETLSIFFCVGFLFSDLCLLFLLLKIAVPPFSLWLELILEEMESGAYFILTILKIVPVFLCCCFFYQMDFCVVTLLLSSFFCFLKLFMTKSIKQIFLFVGGLSVVSCVFMSFFYLWGSLFWYMIYSAFNFFGLFSLSKQGPDFYNFVFMTPLPPLSSFFSKTFPNKIFVWLDFFLPFFYNVNNVNNIFLFLS